MVLVVGATGHVGGGVCRLLRDSGTPVRALVRETSAPERVGALRDVGVEIATGDLRQPSSLAAALAGVSTVVSTASATGAPAENNNVLNVDGAGQAELIDAARAAGVEHFIFVSFSGNIQVDTPLRTSKRGTERRLRESGMVFTVVRPSFFPEVWLSPLVGFDPAGGSVLVFGSGDQLLSYISSRDVARFCAAFVGDERTHNRTIELGGEPVSPNEAVRIAEQAVGHALTVQRVAVEALRAQYENAADPLQRSMAGLSLAHAEGDVIDMSETLEEFPLRLRTVREHIEQLVAAGAADAGPHRAPSSQA